ncbi:MAG: S46 family peptidase, partial [Flavobacteriales bacterium]|nr:S46 family peptidase [Flavobacteriales bacterium]
EAFALAASEQGKGALADVLAQLEGSQRDLSAYSTARDLFIEFYVLGPAALQFAKNAGDLAAEEDVDGESLAKFKSRSEGHFKAHDQRVERKIMKAMLPLYLERVDQAHRPASLSELDARFNSDIDAYVENLYATSLVTDKDRMERVLTKWGKSARKKLSTDPLVRLSGELFEGYKEQVSPGYAAAGKSMNEAMGRYVHALSEVYPDSVFWPDANSTLRLSYGRVEGSEPRDAVVYHPSTSLSGVVEKYVPDDAEFDLPERLVDLYRAKDFGPYAVSGDVPVCFTASLHTTGGNSGSPVLNGHGHLIGLNFDRSWESTMSDILFDPNKCRNIAVDVRYVLFIIDKLGGAERLLKEMEIVQQRPVTDQAGS